MVSPAPDSDPFAFQPSLRYDAVWARDSISMNGCYAALTAQACYCGATAPSWQKRFVGVAKRASIVYPFVSYLHFLYHLKTVDIARVRGFFSKERLSTALALRLEDLSARVQRTSAAAGLGAVQMAVCHEEHDEVYCYGNVLVIDARFLVREGDLPDVLRLERVAKGQVSEEAWCVLFARWLSRQCGRAGAAVYRTAFEVDYCIAVNRKFLSLLRKGSAKLDEVTDALIAHELAHIKYNDVIIDNSIKCLIDCIALPTLGLSQLASNSLLLRSMQRSEKRADLAAARHKGGAEGLCRYIKMLQRQNRELLALHPQLLQRCIDSEGNYLDDREHPPLSERIRYLRAAPL